jgi:hypothetical protein
VVWVGEADLAPPSLTLLLTKQALIEVENSRAGLDLHMQVEEELVIGVWGQPGINNTLLLGPSP